MILVSSIDRKVDHTRVYRDPTQPMDEITVVPSAFEITSRIYLKASLPIPRRLIGSSSLPPWSSRATGSSGELGSIMVSSRRVQPGRPPWTWVAVRADHHEDNTRPWVRSQGQLVGKGSKRVLPGEPNSFHPTSFQQFVDGIAKPEVRNWPTFRAFPVSPFVSAFGMVGQVYAPVAAHRRPFLPVSARKPGMG